MMKFPEQFRYHNHPMKRFRSSAGDPFGCFRIPGRVLKGRRLLVLANDASSSGWDHVSVSLEGSPTECPSWDEMAMVKDLFWDKQDCVVQFHPPESQYVNLHPGVLHLWKPLTVEIPLPPIDEV